MLKFLTVSSCLLAFVFGQGEVGETESTESGETEGGVTEGEGEGESNSRGSNYYQDLFDGTNYVPYAIDQCSAANYDLTSFIMAQCIDGDHVQVSYYTTSECSDEDLSSTMIVNSTKATFKCTGDAMYAGFTVGVEECTAMVYLAIDECVLYSSSSTVFSTFSCASTTEGSLMLYLNPGCSGGAYENYNADATCTYAFDENSMDINWQISYCTVQTPSTTQGSEDTTTTNGGGTTTTTSSSTSSGGTTTSSTNPTSAGNTISKNIFGILIMVACIMIATL